MEKIPAYVTVVFMLTAFLTAGIFIWTVRPVAERSRFAKFLLFAIPFWMAFHYLLGRQDFFSNTSAFPPRLFLFGLMPSLATIAAAFIPAGRPFVGELSLTKLSAIHIVRVPVEITLASLAAAGVVPEIMTFHGTNFDILSGLTSPLAVYLASRKDRAGRLGLAIWNAAALLLVLNVVITAIFCIPSPLQKLAFDQPNVAVLHSPFIWLPTLIVPVVLFAHLASLYQLLRPTR